MSESFFFFFSWPGVGRVGGPANETWEDPGVDGLNIRSFEPYSDAAMQETTRTFFKALPNKQTNAKRWGLEVEGHESSAR